MNKYIQKLIQEQFNIGNMNLHDNKQKHNINIFNKNFNHPYYYNVLDGTVTEDEIKELNSLVEVAAPKDKNELKKIISFYSKKYPDDSINWLNVYGITDMSHLFEKTKYNGDISKWDTSNVTDMSYMFYKAYSFNQPIGDWNVSNVIDMEGMFAFSNFNRPIGSWNVINVTNMRHMFYKAYSFNQFIGEWNVNNVTNMYCMFAFSNFNQPISNWNVSSVIDMKNMFYDAHNFNQDISTWNISANTNTTDIFMFCPIKKEYKCKKYR